MLDCDDMALDRELASGNLTVFTHLQNLRRLAGNIEAECQHQQDEEAPNERVNDLREEWNNETASLSVEELGTLTKKVMPVCGILVKVTHP